MEDELKCAHCNNFFSNPVLLPCFHSLCYACAVNLQEKFTTSHSDSTKLTKSFSPKSSISSASSHNIDNLSITDLGSSIISDLDKLSLFSETDSGVITHSQNTTSASSTYGRGSYISQCSPKPPLLPTSSLYSTYLPCAQCSRMIYMDASGVDSLTKNTCLENIVERYLDSKKLSTKCQMCAHEEKDAVAMCEQCEIFYCSECCDAYHPMRGPLQKHNLTGPRQGRELLKLKNRTKESKCSDHQNELVNFYCLLCKCNCCSLCINESIHLNHQIMPLNQYCKSQKAELSKILQSLSEKAKISTEQVTKLRSLPDIIEENSSQFKKVLVTEIDEMIRQLEAKKTDLVDYIELEKSNKIKSVKDEISKVSSKIQKTTGLLQFCVETLKEQDASSFLHISENMIERMSDIDTKYQNDREHQPPDTDFDFKLNSDTILKEIKKLNYKQLKVPLTPNFVAEECINSINDSSIILSWKQNAAKQSTQAFLLEIDDGTNEGHFKEVYRGQESICQVSGLMANCVYNARVRAFNPAGFSEFSKVISIAATPTLWFTFNAKTSHSDMVFSNSYMTVSNKNFEDRVVLGSVGFSKGVHYWEVAIDRYENQPDPSFGVARFDCAKDHMLGKDNKSWCMYIDSKRSWFMHNGKHFGRIDNGIQQGCVIGVLLDLHSHTLSYFVNDEPQGEIAFKSIPSGVYYPAFSFNRNVQITLSSGLEPPPCYVSDSYSE